jgi:uncharacterized protein (DUF58 family)
MSLLTKADTLARALPSLVLSAGRLATTLHMGTQARQRAGVGDTFWQYRPLAVGEPAHSIDWRRSAREDTLYVREREAQHATTLWFWLDPSKSLDFASSPGLPLKKERAMVMLLALAQAAALGNARVGLMGQTPRLTQRPLEIFPEYWLNEGNGFPETFPPHMRDAVLVTDSLWAPEEIATRLERFSSNGIRVQTLVVNDPQEVSPTLQGAVELFENEHGTRDLIGANAKWRENYKNSWAAHRAFWEETHAKHHAQVHWHTTDKDPLLLLMKILLEQGSAI